MTPRLLLWLAGGLIVVSGIAVTVFLALLRAEAFDEADKLTRWASRIVEEQCTRTIQSVEPVLEVAARRIEALRASGAATTEAARAILREQLPSRPFLRAIWIQDAAGRIAFDSDEGNIGVDLSDRPYFAVHRQRPDTRLYIGDPILSRSTGGWFIAVSLPIRGAGGQLDGVLVAALEPQYFGSLWRTEELGEGSLIALFNQEGMLMMRSPFLPEAIGRTLSFAGVVPSFEAVSRASYRATSTLDGRERILSARKLSAFPEFVVVAGQSLDVVLGGWRRTTTVAASSWLAMALAIGFGARRLEREWTSRLREQERLRVVMDNAPIAIFLKDREGRYLMANATYDDWFSRPGRSVVGSRDEDFVPAHYAALVRETDQEVVSTGAVVRHERPHFRTDHAVKDVLVTKFPVRDAGGSVVGISGFILDITERSAADRALQAAVQRFHTMLSSLRSGIIVGGADDRVEFVNPAYCALLGLSDAPSELVGLSAAQVVAKIRPRYAEPEAAVARVAAIVAAGVPVSNEEVVLRDGRTLLRDFVPIEVGGRRFGRLWQYIDITDRKSKEDQLRQAQKMEAVGQLTGGVAHDFNNLLSIILGNLELLGERGLNEQTRERLFNPAMRAALRGAELTHRLLAYSRRQPLQSAPTDVTTVIADLGELLARTLGETVVVDTVVAPDLALCMVDRGQLENALLNLAINARDAMPGGGRIVIEAGNARIDADHADDRLEIAAGRYVLLSVSDDGQGMTEETRRRAFEPFFTTKGIGKGSGLGLSMVFGFVKQSNGHISIYSELGRGTTIKLYLPVADASDVPRDAVAADGPSAGPADAGRVVLVVEDQEDVRTVAVAQFERLGWRAMAAGSGAEALTLLDRSTGVDLLFTDVVLPRGMSGAELAAEALRRRPGLKVLYTSGYTENAILHHGRLDPGVCLLSKPYQRKELVEALRQVMAS